MTAGELWRERVRPIALFPGLILAAFVVEQTVLLPRAAQRAPAERLAHWRAHAELHPDFALSQLRLGTEYQALGRSLHARAAFERALSIEADLQAAAVGINATVRATQGHAAAVEQLRAYLTDHPDCYGCRQNLAASLLLLGDADAARLEIEQVLANESYRLPLHYGRMDLGVEARVLAARIREAQGDLDGAVELVRAAVRRSGSSPSARFHAGRLLIDRDPAAALAHLRVYRAMRPADLRGPLHEARARAALGDVATANRVLDAIQALVPNLPPAERRRWSRDIELARADVSWRTGDRESARARVRELVARDPSHQPSRRLLAEIEDEGERD